jgi:hypothetical protein
MFRPHGQRSIPAGDMGNTLAAKGLGALHAAALPDEAAPGGARVALVRSERAKVVQQVLLIIGRQRREVVDDCVGL